MRRPLPWDDPAVAARDLAQAIRDIGAGREGTVNLTAEVPGWEGSTGPGPGQYARPHVYARDVCSGAGNCRCGADLGDWVHVQAAPGVAVPRGYRHGPLPAAYADTYRQLDADTSGGEVG